MVLPGPEAAQLTTYLGYLTHERKGGLWAAIFFILHPIGWCTHQPAPLNCHECTNVLSRIVFLYFFGIWNPALLAPQKRGGGTGFNFWNSYLIIIYKS